MCRCSTAVCLIICLCPSLWCLIFSHPFILFLPYLLPSICSLLYTRFFSPPFTLLWSTPSLPTTTCYPSITHLSVAYAITPPSLSSPPLQHSLHHPLVVSLHHHSFLPTTPSNFTPSHHLNHLSLSPFYCTHTPPLHCIPTTSFPLQYRYHTFQPQHSLLPSHQYPISLLPHLNITFLLPITVTPSLSVLPVTIKDRSYSPHHISLFPVTT